MFLSSGTVPRHAARRSGQLDHRFPGGESEHELTARTGHALRVIVDQAGTDDAIVVAPRRRRTARTSRTALWSSTGRNVELAAMLANLTARGIGRLFAEGGTMIHTHLTSRRSDLVQYTLTPICRAWAARFA